MKKRYFILLFLAAKFSYANECGTNEVLVASCNIPGKGLQVATFCANKKSDTIRYTFSKNGSSELIVDFDTQHKLKRWVDLGTYTTYLGFERGVYSYVLSVPEEKPGAVALLDVKKNGNIISTKKCDSNSFGAQDIKIKSIDDVPDSLVRENGFKFP